MRTDRRVFVMDKDPRRDVSDAGRYGELLFVYDAGEHKPSVWSNAMIKDVLDRMTRMEYDADIDYVVVTGNTVMITLVVCSLLARDGMLNLLLFDSAQEEYVHKTVSY